MPMCECQQHCVLDISLDFLIACEVVPVQFVVALVWQEHGAAELLELGCGALVFLVLLRLLSN